MGARPAAAAGECGHDGVYALLVCGQPDVLLAHVLTGAAKQCEALAALSRGFAFEGSPWELFGAVAPAGPTPALLKD